MAIGLRGGEMLAVGPCLAEQFDNFVVAVVLGIATGRF